MQISIFESRRGPSMKGIHWVTIVLGLMVGAAVAFLPILTHQGNVASGLASVISVAGLVLAIGTLGYSLFKFKRLTGLALASLFFLANTLRLVAIIWLKNGESAWVSQAYYQCAVVGALYLLGWFSLLVGYKFHKDRAKPLVLSSSVSQLKHPPVAYLLIVFLVGLLSYSWVVKSIGGIRYLLGNLQQRQLLLAGKHYFVTVARLMYISALALLGRGLQRGWRNGQTVGGMICLIVAFAAFATLGGRTQAITPVIMALILIQTRHRIGIVPMTGLACAIGTFVIFGNAFRQSGGDIGEIQYGFLELIDEFLDTDGFILMLNLIQHGLPFQYGAGYIALLANVIPRALWPNKPPTTDLLVSQYHNELSWSGKTVTVFGELYLNFWIVGVVAGGILWGKVLKALDIRMLRSCSYWVALFGAIAITRLTCPGPQSTQPFVLFEELVGLTITALPSLVTFMRSTRVGVNSSGNGRSASASR